MAITALVRTYSLRRSVLDIPSHRSSHHKPMPRGGGLAISVVCLGAIVALGHVGWLSHMTAIALIGGGVMVSVIGWIDDHQGVSALWRALVHLGAAFWALWWLGGLPMLDIGIAKVSLGLVGPVVASLGVAWLINLYNFMDGTDGIAGVQALCAGVLGAMFLYDSGERGLAAVSLSVAIASAGFLVWNWPPARIFMGDVGSCFLGFTFAVLALASELTGALPALVWSILLAVFIGDATFTLLKRLASGKRWYVAHRSHAYQRLIQLGLTHRQVALGVLLVNLMIVWPLAFLAYRREDLIASSAACALVMMWIIWLIIQRAYQSKVRGETDTLAG